MRKSVLFCLTAVCLTGLTVTGQEQKPKLALDVAMQKEVKVQRAGVWKTELVPVEKATRNDLLVYTITYQNQGKSEARDASILDPIPQGAVYVPGSAEGKDTEITFSIDGGKTFQKAPVKYLVKNKDGSLEEKIASPEMYTHIQWLVKKPVLPGQSGTVSFKIKVK